MTKSNVARSRRLTLADLLVVVAIMMIIDSSLLGGRLQKLGRFSSLPRPIETSVMEVSTTTPREREARKSASNSSPKENKVDDFIVEICAGTVLLFGSSVTNWFARTTGLRIKLGRYVGIIRRKYQRRDTAHAQKQISLCDAFDSTPMDQLGQLVMIVDQLQENEVRQTVAMEKKRAALRKARNRRKS